MLDLTNEKHAHADQRLRTEPIIWLSSVRPNGRPHLVPVWFLWDGATILIFSEPGKQKVRNMQQQPAVMLALEALDEGEDIVLIEGHAALVKDQSLSAAMPAYREKYARLMQQINSSPEQMASQYNQAIVITPSKITAW